MAQSINEDTGAATDQFLGVTFFGAGGSIHFGILRQCKLVDLFTMNALVHKCDGLGE